MLITLFNYISYIQTIKYPLIFHNVQANRINVTKLTKNKNILFNYIKYNKPS